LTLNLKKLSSLTDRYHLVSCNLYDFRSQLKAKFRGGLCTLFKNGDYVSSFKYKNSKNVYQAGLRYFSKDGTKKWEKRIDLHHELNTFDDKSITTLSSKNYDINGSQVRFDTINVYSTEGKTLAHLDTHDLRHHIFSIFGKELHKQPQKEKENDELFHANAALVIPSEFNSIYSGEDNDLLIAVSFSRFSGIAIFSSIHKKIIWSYQNKQAIMTHHLNILKNGNLLFIINDWLTEEARNDNNDYHLVNDKNRSKYSSILEISPDKAIINKIDAKDNVRLYTKFRGGVSITPNANYLFTTEDGWVYEIKPHTKTVQGIWSFEGSSKDKSIYRTYSIDKDIAKRFIENKNINKLLQPE
jgi:hypothetical protein